MITFGERSQGNGGERRYPLRYGRVYFELRKEFGLSVSEALLLDVIGTLSKRTGWCYASRAYLADMLGLSERSTRRMISELSERGLVVRHASHSRWVRPTGLWITRGQPGDGR